MKITKSIEIDMGHCVTNHNSKCKHFHGHRYTIKATVDDKLITTSGASDEGMVIDYSDLKKSMMEVIDEPYDHAFTIWCDDPRAAAMKAAHLSWNNNPNKFHVVSFVPTAENMAKHWFDLLESYLKIHFSIKLYSIEVFETPTSSAIYSKGDL